MTHEIDIAIAGSRPLQTIGFAMLMQTMERPTDMKIDRLEERMDEGFAHVDARFSQVDARFSQVDARFSQVDARFQRVEEDIRELRAEQKAGVKELRSEIQTGVRELRSDFQAMQRNMIFGFFSLTALFLTYAGFQLS